MLDIGEVAKRTGLTTSALRFYEEKKLIQSAGRKGLRRLFDPDVLEQLEFISLGRIAGFSLEDIAAMFSDNGRYKINRNQLAAKADQLDLNIKQMVAVRDGLRHAINCSAPSHRECPKFQQLLRIAGKKKVKNKPSKFHSKIVKAKKTF